MDLIRFRRVRDDDAPIHHGGQQWPGGGQQERGGHCEAVRADWHLTPHTTIYIYFLPFIP